MVAFAVVPLFVAAIAVAAAGDVARVRVVVVVGEPLPLPNVVIVVASKFFSKHLLSPEGREQSIGRDERTSRLSGEHSGENS